MKKFIAVDIETSGLYPHKGSKIFCIAINTGKAINIVEDIEKARPILEDPTIVKVIHNAAFDSFWLRRMYGIKVRSIWDTRLMEQILLGENLPRGTKNEDEKKALSSSLLYTLERYGLATLENKSLGAAFASRPLYKPLTKEEREYAKNDVRYLLQLQAMQEYRLAKLDLMRLANMENKLVEVVVDMRDRGIGFDEKLWRSLAMVNERKYNDLLKTLPPQVSNWNSPVQVKKYFRARGIPVESLTGIEELAAKYNDEVLNRFIEVRACYKAATAYGLGWLEDDLKGTTVDPDGRVRADFEQILNTGRFSCSHPNLQQLPRDGAHRAAFVPKRGHVFILGDFSGQEIGIMAAASGEDVWIKAMLRREDIHSLTASLLYVKEWSEGREKGCAFPKKCDCKVHKELRHHAKTLNFAIAYGAGPQRIAASLKLTEKQGSKLLFKYKRVVRKLSRWLDNNAKETVKTRLSYSADPFKRRRVLRDPEDWMLRNIGKNNPVQAAGANCLKVAMISLTDTCPIVLVVHDEIVIEVPKAKAKKALVELRSIMEKAADYVTGIPGLIQADCRIATSMMKEG